MMARLLVILSLTTLTRASAQPDYCEADYFEPGANPLHLTEDGRKNTLALCTFFSIYTRIYGGQPATPRRLEALTAEALAPRIEADFGLTGRPFAVSGFKHLLGSWKGEAANVMAKIGEVTQGTFRSSSWITDIAVVTETEGKVLLAIFKTTIEPPSGVDISPLKDSFELWKFTFDKENKIRKMYGIANWLFLERIWMATHGAQGNSAVSSESSAAGALALTEGAGAAETEEAMTLWGLPADAKYCQADYKSQSKNEMVLCQFVHLYDGTDMNDKLLSVDVIQKRFSELMTPTVHFIHQPDAKNFVSHGHQFYGEWTGSVWDINFLGHLPPSLPTHDSRLRVLDIGVSTASDGKKLIGLFSVQRRGPRGCAPAGRGLVGLALTFNEEGKVTDFELYDGVIAENEYYRRCIDAFAAGVGPDDYYYGHTSTLAPGGQVLAVDGAGTAARPLRSVGVFNAAGAFAGAVLLSVHLCASRRGRGEQHRALLGSEGLSP